MKNSVFIKLLAINWAYNLFFPMILAFYFFSIRSFIVGHYEGPGINDLWPWLVMGSFCSFVSSATYGAAYKVLRYDAGKHNRAVRFALYLFYGPILLYTLFTINSLMHTVYAGPSSGGYGHLLFLLFLSPATILFTMPFLIFTARFLKDKGLLQRDSNEI